MSDEQQMPQREASEPAVDWQSKYESLVSDHRFFKGSVFAFLRSIQWDGRGCGQESCAPMECPFCCEPREWSESKKEWVGGEHDAHCALASLMEWSKA